MEELIVILDYGMGNTGSMLNMISYVGGNAMISKDPEDIYLADAVILPGVGAFDNGISKLSTSGVIEILRKRVLQQKLPFLGVCLGMQLLFEKSEEGTERGLGWLKGEVVRFSNGEFSNPSIKIPHMGWNTINHERDNALLCGLDDNSRFYFVHSYHVSCVEGSDILATTAHGYSFPSIVQRENIIGVQFHPEKSHSFGMQIFRNFMEIVRCSKHE